MMNKSNLWLFIIKKISSIITKLKYKNVPPKYIYFYRDTIACKLNQLRYFFNDYIIRKPYKIISYEGEFGEELQFVLPHAYWHYKNGTLKKTKSFPTTNCLYYFSPNHEECFFKRTNEGNYNYDLPRILYSQDYNIKKWLPVPLQDVYKNDIYLYNKPALIIANRYNTEWDGPPISYLSINMLDYIISSLKQKYTIIYNRPSSSHIVNDNSEIKNLDEFDWLHANYPEVILADELYQENRVNASNFNHFQLFLYANCSNFISIHGGTATLASYFGGKNLIFSKDGPEHYFNCYKKLYPQFSGAEIFLATNESKLKALIKKVFV